ncbi:MAG: hypothetical protein NT175_12180 [Bacteroidetes bacterium]|nr:hypothetical protein [Bacteroidota bacterium]
MKSYAQERNNGFNILTPVDSVFLVNVPKLLLSEEYRYIDLPYKLDNSTLPFLRPVFEQDAASCGQAASIGYNFTYEIDRARILPADLPQNQYPTHFVWNFMNTEGLLILKNWLHDHLDGSPFGGTANFYAGIIIPYLLPQGTPEAGKNVIIVWYPEATHAVTIVGYNDSIRFDYNIDGRFTNDEDINNDGVIDMKDWEIGGLKFVNSYGVSWGDSGFCYMMYKTLADMYGAGGIWNNSVNVIKVIPDYEPLLTMKVTLRHTCRNKIKVTAGISPDTSAAFPVSEMEFPIFDYQGGEFYMQGGHLEEDKTIEFGLDITPLLSYMNNGEAAKIFLQITEDDPGNKGTGEIVEWSVIDYINGIHETMCQFVNVPINDNDFTRLSVIKTVTFNKIRITDDSLPPIIPGEAYTHQFSATGGTPPYSWKLKADYSFNRIIEPFPLVDQEQLTPTNNQNGFVTKKLGFSFPYYNETFDSVTLHTGGFLMFDQQTYPTPYIQDLNLLCRSTRSVSPLMNWSLIIIQ